jgi:hypothetical protein
MNEIGIHFSSDTEQGLLLYSNKISVSSWHEHWCQATVILRIFLHISNCYPVVVQISLEG